MFRQPPIFATIAFFAMAALICLLVYMQALRDGYSTLSERAEARLSQHNDRFLGQVSRFQQLVNSLAQHPDIFASVRDGTLSPSLNTTLSSAALRTSAKEIFIVNAAGALVTSTEDTETLTELRRGDLRRFDYIRTALDGGLGWSHGLEDGGEPRTAYIARAIFAKDGPVVGAVVVTVAVRTLELEWSFGPEPVAFFDRTGIAFVTNRPDLALRRNPALSGSGAPPKSISAAALRPFFDYNETQSFGHRIWEAGEPGTLPSRSLVRERFIPRVQLTAFIFQDTRSIQERAVLLSTLAAVSLTLIGVLLWSAFLRRQALARLLQQEEAENARLEARVLARTEELRQAQSQLVASNRLSALGEMSAGISHELNQPLGAIRNFAENGQKLLSLGRTEAASENLNQVTTQVDRIGRIIRSLRAFAKNEPQEMATVDIAAVTRSALAVSDIRLKREGVQLVQTGLDNKVSVSAGEVRLQQVIVNILNNAIDAFENEGKKEITVTMKTHDTRAELSVSDTGPGIKEPDRVFDPFYSTKDPGGSSGMGLGLAISHGIVGSFGGTLRCKNAPNRGAVFTIELPLAEAVA